MHIEPETQMIAVIRALVTIVAARAHYIICTSWEIYPVLEKEVKDIDYFWHVSITSDLEI